MAESMRARWERLDEPVQLGLAELTALVQPAFPGQQVMAADLAQGGRANTNWRLQLSGRPAPVLLRLCTRQAKTGWDVPPTVLKEAALHHLLAATLPVPRLHFAAVDNPVTGHPYLIREWVEGQRLELAADRLDPTTLLDLARDIGAVLAGIHRVRFAASGFLDDVLQVVPFPPTVGGGLVDFLRTLLGEHGAERLGPELTRALFAFAERENDYGATWVRAPHLVHADFGGSNLLVQVEQGRARVAGVVDWEFAFSSGSPFIDLGNLLRPPLGDLPGFEESVAAGYRAAGGVLPDDWRRRSLYEDLTAWAGFLGRPQVGDTVVQDARSMIARVLAGLERT